MQYIVGTNMSTTVKIAGKIDGLIKSFKLTKINAVNPPPAKVTISNKKKLGALSVSASLFRLKNCRLSLSKVTKEFFLMIYGTVRITTHIAILKSVLLFVRVIIKPAIPKPRFIPTKNIRFQKLSLLSLDCRKLIFGFLGLSYIPPYSLGITGVLVKESKTNGLTEVAGVFLRFSQKLVKSSMTILGNLWLHIYSIIISKYYRFTKQIKVFLLVLSFVLCGNCSLVFAKNEPTTQYNRQQIASLISNAEKENQIPSGLLAAIAKLECNTQAYALNVNGNAVFNKSLEEASGIVKKKLASGLKNIDLGVMQLNYRWHGDKFINVTQMLMPENNIKYAASLLKSLRTKHGSWHKAVRYYHSAKPEHHRKYSRKVVAYWLARDRTQEKGTGGNG
jgi:Transglycosylase SLT domain